MPLTNSLNFALFLYSPTKATVKPVIAAMAIVVGPPSNLTALPINVVALEAPLISDTTLAIPVAKDRAFLATKIPAKIEPISLRTCL